jgi:hypothetical protein
VLENYRLKRSKHLFLLIPAMVIWVNSHPGFAMGFILLSIYFIDELLSSSIKFPLRNSSAFRESIRNSNIGHFLSMAAFLLIAASMNPAGPQILVFPFETISIGILRDFIQEWQSPNFHDAVMQPFIWTVILLFVVLAYSKKQKAISEILLISIFAYLALLAGRNVALFALAAAPVLSRHLDDVMTRIGNTWGLSLFKDHIPNRLQKILNNLILITVVLLSIIKIGQVIPAKNNLEHFQDILPVEATDFLNANPQQGHLFNSYNWGGYLIWQLNNMPVYIDGRTDLYGDELIGEWLSIVGAEDGWQDKLERWKIELILLEPHWPLIRVLEANQWNLLRKFEGALLFEKN